MAVIERSSTAGAVTLSYSSLRGDWYKSNQAMPRAVRSVLLGKRRRVFAGFPRQWIPVFEYFGVEWEASIPPEDYVPIFSEMDEDAVRMIVKEAKAHGELRVLVEAGAACDAVISDFIYIIDNTYLPQSELQRELSEIESALVERRKSLKLNSWLAYGRPSIRSLEAEVTKVRAPSREAVVLPCALRRPYGASRTHQRILGWLASKGQEVAPLHKIVITAAGVLPEDVWTLPQVLAYDAGVPDIYRILRLARSYFRSARYSHVIDCLSFEPYSDVLRIVAREGLIERLTRMKPPGSRPFWIRN